VADRWQIGGILGDRSIYTVLHVCSKYRLYQSSSPRRMAGKMIASCISKDVEGTRGKLAGHADIRHTCIKDRGKHGSDIVSLILRTLLFVNVCFLSLSSFLRVVEV